MIKNIVFGLCASTMLATSAIAAPISTQPAAPVGLGGDVSLVYIGTEAGDTSSLSFGATDNIFCNHGAGSCAAATTGQAFDLGAQTGALNFQLHDLTVPKMFNVLGTASDGYYHANVSANYADLGIFSISSDASDAIAALLQAGGIVSYVGFEDRIGGDYDYNDFVFAVIINKPKVTTDPDPTPAPEPASLALFGAGLLGLRKKRKALATK